MGVRFCLCAKSESLHNKLVSLSLTVAMETGKGKSYLQGLLSRRRVMAGEKGQTTLHSINWSRKPQHDSFLMCNVSSELSLQFTGGNEVHLSLAFRKLLRENSFRQATAPVLGVLQAEGQCWYLTAVRSKLILHIVLPLAEVSDSLESAFAWWELWNPGIHSFNVEALVLDQLFSSYSSQ